MENVDRLDLKLTKIKANSAPNTLYQSQKMTNAVENNLYYAICISYIIQIFQRVKDTI